MSQFELVEDYLTNRMDDGTRSAFEEQMNADPQLKAEVNLQKGIIEGVKSARAAELKAMLNNVPVGGTYSALTGKIAIATISAGIIGAVIYFSLQPAPTEEQQAQTEQTTTEQPLIPIDQPEEQEQVETSATPIEEPQLESDKKTKTTSTQAAKPKKEVKVSPLSIDVLDLTEDMNDSGKENNPPKQNNTPTVSASTVEVELVNGNKNYSFHYQFKDSKLALYGPFDSSLYEIIELNGTVHSLFLYYNDSYYHLDEREHTIVPLIMIRDTELLGKLEKYRKKN